MSTSTELIIDYAIRTTVTTERPSLQVYQEWKQQPDELPDGVVHRPIYDFRPGIILMIIDEKIRDTEQLISNIEHQH